MTDDLTFDEPRLELVDDETHRLVEDWRVEFRGHAWTVRAGFETDGASIPWLLQLVCGSPNRKPRLFAALVHDAAYSGILGDMPRDLADDIYRDMQIALGIPAWRAWVEWCALRVFGGPHWAGDPDLND